MKKILIEKFDDNSSVVVELELGVCTVTLDPGTGTPAEVFREYTAEDLIFSLSVCKLRSTRKIRELIEAAKNQS